MSDLTIKYGAGFPSEGAVAMYSAIFPRRKPPVMPAPSPLQPWNRITIPPSNDTVDSSKTDSPKIDKCELDEIIDAILALKAQTVEIYKLKALAAAVRERNSK